MDNLTPITREEMLMNDEPLTPITREEKILAGEDLNPVTRREYFLKKYRHAGGDVMVEGLSVTENGTYTAPEGKAYSPVEVAVPLPDNSYLLKEASGSLVSFADGADLPIPSFICNIDAVQDLHGYDSPWVGGASKNKMTLTVENLKAWNTSGTWSRNTYSNRNMKFSILTDDANNVIGIDENGTTSSYPDFVIFKGTLNGSYRLCKDNTRTRVFANGSQVNDGSSDYSFTASGETYEIILFTGAVTLNHQIVKPMLVLSTETDYTFVPYSNICPISGQTGINAWVRGKNLLNIEWESGSYGSIGNKITDTTKIRTVYSIDVKPNVTYALSFQIPRSNNGLICYYTDDNFISRIGLRSTFTTPENCTHISFAVSVESDGTNPIALLEVGASVTEYEPYNPQSQTIQVSWQTEAGEVFGGYVDLVSGVLTVTHYKKQLTRDMDWSKSSTGYNAFYVSGAKISPARKERTAAICNIAKYSSGSEYVSQPWCLTRDGSLGMSTDENIIGGTTIDNWKDYISNNTVEICYELETPIVIQLDGNQIKSLLGTNNAWCDTGDVDIDYFAKEVEG